MRWFKHLSMAHADKAMGQILEEFGAEGYGLFWLLMEDIAAPMEAGKMIPTSCHSLSRWSEICHCSSRRFRSIITRLGRHELIRVRLQTTSQLRSNSNETWWELDANFEQTLSKLEANLVDFKTEWIEIAIPNILKYKDEYSKKSGATQEKVQENSALRTEYRDIYNPPTPLSVGTQPVAPAQSPQAQNVTVMRTDPSGELWVDAARILHPKKGNIDNDRQALWRVYRDPARKALFDKHHALWIATEAWTEKEGHYAPPLWRWIRDEGYFSPPPQTAAKKQQAVSQPSRSWTAEELFAKEV